MGKSAARVNYYVAPDGRGGWKGAREGAARPTVKAATKAEAIRLTIEAAKRQSLACVRIMRTDGSVQEERSYPRASDRRARG